MCCVTSTKALGRTSSKGEVILSKSPILQINPDRLFPVEPSVRRLCGELYEQVRAAPIISPHGHTDPAWFACDTPFDNALSLLVTPDHYLLRMLYSRGVALEDLGVPDRQGSVVVSPREGWRNFARRYYLFTGTPSKVWLDTTFAEVFGLTVQLDEHSADLYFDHINECLSQEAFRPRQLLDRFNVAFIATTEHALDPLLHHQALVEQGLSTRVTTTFRPDDVLDPDFDGFAENVERLGEVTGETVASYSGYLNALRARRAAFRAVGATATDHGPVSPFTACLADDEAGRLYGRCLSGAASGDERKLFRGHMLIEMARMSLDDGMVMQLHPGSSRNHNSALFNRFGPDKGADIPRRVDYCEALKPLLNAVGNEPDLELIVFTLDESNYARELAPLAGHYPALRLGPPWWFNDSPEGMLRFRHSVTETAGFYNTAGFNDDTRALLSIPARHDMARRMDARFLAQLVTEGRLSEAEALRLITTLTTDLVVEAYRLGDRVERFTAA
ncbi:Glucuronate isomerase [Congregibacter litoralis KT71]|uniref:Uronate isomerase n=1 Tax=Congregibacter litoralis KT71 TaxID=314285 RepID=A4AC68_9GAMM|nr:Glucuronate isomerase [Congregibacter litoralis KT71]ESZ89444.1 Glucuronate isomerase [Congregibacter litoralis KT71]